MTAKKTTADKAEVKAAKDAEGTAAEELETKLNVDELLEDMPELRAPHRLRLRHKNALKTLAARVGARAASLPETIKKSAGGFDLKTEEMLLFLDLAAEIDEWAESIAVDKEAYELWAEARQDDPAPFLAIMNRYMDAVGESNGSAS